jgi:ankyrin repeat protein
MAAAYYGRVKATEFLLQQGCSTDMIDEEGDTVFHIAAKSDRNDDTKQEIIRCLMKGNVKSDVKNKEGKYPHHYLFRELRLVVRAYWVSS